jgi:hypothetical protein
MCALLRDDAGGRARPTPDAIAIGGRPCANSAAKFWWDIADEIWSTWPDATEFELAALTAGRLAAGRLNPLRWVEQELENLQRRDFGEAVRELVDEFEIIGPPLAVQLHVRCGEHDRLWCSLPMDAVDSDILLYLAGWLLHWAQVPEADWNGPDVRGAIDLDAEGARRQRLSFHLASEHLSEDLFRRTLRVRRVAA